MFVLPHTMLQFAGDIDVQDPLVTGHNVDVIDFHLLMRTTAIARESVSSDSSLGKVRLAQNDIFVKEAEF